MSHHLEKPLDFTEQLFVLEYIECRSYKTAGERVGLSEKEVHLLTKRKAFLDEVERLTQTALGRAEVSAQRIVDELASIAFLDPAELMTNEGRLKDINKMPEHVRRALVGLEITETDVKDVFKVVTKPKLGDKIRALELLGKWSKIKMFTDVVETNASDEVARVKTLELEERVKLMETSRDPSLLESE